MSYAFRHKENLPKDDAMGINITGLDVHVKGPNILGIHNIREDLHDGSKHASGSTEGRNIPETKDNKGQVLHCKECDYKTQKLKPSKALQRLNAHAFRHKENLPKDDAMGIDITGLDVHDVHVVVDQEVHETALGDTHVVVDQEVYVETNLWRHSR